MSLSALVENLLTNGEAMKLAEEVEAISRQAEGFAEQIGKLCLS